MGTIQSKASTAQSCASAMARAAASIGASSEVAEDSASHYSGNDLLKTYLAQEKAARTTGGQGLSTFLTLVQSMSAEFVAADQHISQEIQATNATLNSWQTLGKAAK